MSNDEKLQIEIPNLSKKELGILSSNSSRNLNFTLKRQKTELTKFHWLLSAFSRYDLPRGEQEKKTDHTQIDLSEISEKTHFQEQTTGIAVELHVDHFVFVNYLVGEAPPPIVRIASRVDAYTLRRSQCIGHEFPRFEDL